jgi:hypothetical protein
MPIPMHRLERMLIPQVLTSLTSVAELLYLFAEQPEPHRCYAVVRVSSDLYAAVALHDLRERAERDGTALLSLSLAMVDGLLRAGEPFWRTRIGVERAVRELAPRTRYRRVVLDDDGIVVGVLASTPLGTTRGASPLGLISNPQPSVLGPQGEAAPLAPPYLNIRFDGVAPNTPLIVGRRTPLIVSIGAPSATGGRHSRPFAFNFAGADDPVHFIVSVNADPEMWTVRVHEPALVVEPPGITLQEAEFTVIAKHPGRDKVHLSVQRADSGATVQHVWLAVAAELEPGTPAARPAALPRIEASLPFDEAHVARSDVELVIQPGIEGSVVVVSARLPPNGRPIHARYSMPVGSAALQNLTLRLRRELENIVFYPGRQPGVVQPFINVNSLSVEESIARRACVPLAEAGWQAWDTLFNAPRAPEGLKQLAADLRGLPHGSHLRVVIDNQECIVPWALLYDQPGPITQETLAWEGFWGYRYILDILPPGRYPPSTIDDTAPGALLLFNDDPQLAGLTGAQEQFARRILGDTQVSAAWGHTHVQHMLRVPPQVTLVYVYCHGEHESGAITPRAFASDSALYFSRSQRLRIADLRRLPAGPLVSRPLVFLNACEGATQYPFYYDGFMPFFVEQQLARGFIGTEVKAPTLLAHDFALRFMDMFGQGEPVGAILWKLRRHYLDTHHTILGFNYSLYCPGDVRLAQPLPDQASQPH